jgi:rhamnosyl/mannosyltransferase
VEEDEGVEAHRVGRRFSFRKWDYCPGLPRVMEAMGPLDLLHLHVPNPTMLLAVWRRARDVRLVITHHSDILGQGVWRHALRPFERRVYARAGRVLCTSREYAAGSALLQRFAHKVEVVPLGLDLQPYLYPTRRALAFAEELGEQLRWPTWLVVARCVAYKNIELALRALGRLPERHRGSLLVIGEGPLRARLEGIAAELGVAERVRWMSYADGDELAGAYRAATALWLPSNARNEAFGLVQVEAMASGCPVINTNIAHSGVTWVSRHGQTGLTVPVNDAGALAAAASKLAGDPALRRRLGEAGRERAVEQFDHLAMAQRTVEVYRRLLAEPSADETGELAELSALDGMRG